MTVAWVFPGQGSQKIGMAKQIENLPNTKAKSHPGWNDVLHRVSKQPGSNVKPI
jgi:malonyl CoA-acyl carrier protein transacylase